jgi:pilus assembly protein Flp/PilA
MDQLKQFARELWRSDDGATAIEYSLLAALIAVVIIASVTTIGQTFADTFETVALMLAPAGQ